MLSHDSIMQRFTRRHPCPICKGHDNLPRGAGRRCGGFVSSDGQYIHCQRAEYAGALPLVEGSATYAHRAHGRCRCGVQHAAAAGPASDAPRIVAAYDYCDADGMRLFQAVRFDPKGFKQRRPVGEGWEWNLRGVTPVLYRLPELLAQPDRAVWVVEGEKDAEALVAIGLLATCNPMGAGKWRREYTARLAGRHVLIVPDHDLPGQRHAEGVAAALQGVAASVRIVELGGHEAGYDVSDWLAEGHRREELEALARQAPLCGQPAPAHKVVIPTARELLAQEFPEPKMVVPGLIVEGATLFAGSPKVGKSYTMQHLAIAVASGGYAFGKLKCEQGRVAYLALEDSQRLCQKRIRQLLGGKDCPERLHICNSWRRFDDGGIEDLDAWLCDHPDTRMVVVDTLQRVRPRETTARGLYQQDYEALSPLADLSHKHNVAIVCVHHTRKMTSDDVLDMVSGTQALAGAVDAIMVLQRARFGTDGVLSVMGRDVEEQAYAVSWDRELAQWRLEGNAEDFARSREQNAILAVLKRAGRALGIQEIADRVGRAANSGLRMLLSKLVEAGLAISPQRGHYRTAEPAADEDGLSSCHFVTADDADEEPIPLFSQVTTLPWDEEDDDQAVQAMCDNSDKVTNEGRPEVRCRCGRRMWTRPLYATEAQWVCSNCGVEYTPHAMREREERDDGNW